MSDTTTEQAVINQEVAEAVKAAFAATLTRNQGVISRLLEGIGHDQSLIALSGGGSHLNWLLGHLSLSRDQLSQRIGGDSPTSQEMEGRYDYGSKPCEPAQAEAFTELVERLSAAQERLGLALAGLTPAQLSESDGRRTLSQRIDFALWHEAYHIGQMVLYRRAAGLASPIG